MGVSDRDYMRDLPGYRATFGAPPTPRRGRRTPAGTTCALVAFLLACAAVTVAQALHV